MPQNIAFRVGWSCTLVCCMALGFVVHAKQPSPTPSSRPVVKKIPSKSKQKTPSWRVQTRKEIRAELKRWLPQTKRFQCSSGNEWSLTVYPNAKRSARIIMKELKSKLRKSLNPAQIKALSKRVRHHVMGGIIRTVLLEGRQHNIGVIRLKGRTWTDAKGNKHPLLVFRGAFTQAPLRAGSCVQALLTDGKVRHLVSLYDSDLLAVDDLRKQERLAAKKAGATYNETRSSVTRYGHWRAELEHKSTFSNSKKLRKVMQQVAWLIKEQILRPQGTSPRGNVFFHCGGGMHRSGVLAGVLRRCINKDPMSQIVRLYKYHTAYTGPDKKGGYEPLLQRFIRDFDCQLLK